MLIKGAIDVSAWLINHINVKLWVLSSNNLWYTSDMEHKYDGIWLPKRYGLFDGGYTSDFYKLDIHGKCQSKKIWVICRRTPSSQIPLSAPKKPSTQKNVSQILKRHQIDIDPTSANIGMLISKRYQNGIFNSAWLIWKWDIYPAPNGRNRFGNGIP